MKLQQRPSEGSGTSSAYTYFASRTARCPRRKSAATTPTKAGRSRGTSRTCSPSAMATRCRLARDAVPVGCLRRPTPAGWMAGPDIINYRSGLPFTPTMSRDVANIGVGNQRPNRIGSGSSSRSDDRRVVRQDRVRRARLVHVRQFGAGILRADHQWNVDASLFKRFAVPSGKTIEFRAEAFNLLNSVYFARRTRTSTPRPEVE